MILFVGGSDSGKSRLAEERACAITAGEKIYLATMLAADAGAKARVRRHRKMREGKGFVTIERPFDVRGVAELLDDPGHATVLLECAANLMANELFERGRLHDENVTDDVLTDILELSRAVGSLLVVTDTFIDDGDYDDETSLYIQLLDRLNEQLAVAADEVVRL